MKLDMDSDGIHGTLELGNNRMRVVLENVEIQQVEIQQAVDYYAVHYMQAGPASVTMQLRVTGPPVLCGHSAADYIIPPAVPPTPVPVPDEPLPFRTIELED